LLPPNENLLLGQSEQFADPAKEYFPPAQFTHFIPKSREFSRTDFVLFGQSSQTTEPAGADLPGGQAWQAIPDTENVPLRQSSQYVEPSTSCSFPASQFVHPIDSFIPYLFCGHNLQLASPESA
jgi:hypothetical protein